MRKFLDTAQEVIAVMLVFALVGLAGGNERFLTTIPEYLLYSAIVFALLFINHKIYTYRRANRNDD